MRKIIVILVIGCLIVLLGNIGLEIVPEIKRINENNAKIREQNKQVIQDRGFGNYDCTYYPDQKVRNCVSVP